MLPAQLSACGCNPDWLACSADTDDVKRIPAPASPSSKNSIERSTWSILELFLEARNWTIPRIVHLFEHRTTSMPTIASLREKHVLNEPARKPLRWLVGVGFSFLMFFEHLFRLNSMQLQDQWLVLLPTPTPRTWLILANLWPNGYDAVKYVKALKRIVTSYHR